MAALRIALALASGLGLAALGCGGPTPAPDAGGADAPIVPARATLAWRVRCDAMGGCTPPPARAIDASDGESGHAVACDVTSFDGVSRVLELDAELPGSHGIHVSGATFPLGGGRVGGDACVVDVTEAADGPLSGACSANTPSVDSPCQIQRLTLDAGVLAFELRCAELPAVGVPGIRREVGPAASSTGFVLVTVTGCRGL